MARLWEANADVTFARRLGKHPAELDRPVTRTGGSCPDIWELSDGNYAVIGRDLTDAYASRLPSDVNIGGDERLVVIPARLLAAAKPDIPDA